jgi:hypothetical protein
MPPWRISLPGRAELLHGLPLIFGLAALAGMAITVGDLVSTPAVDIGAFRSEGHDALALFLGQGLYHNPSGNGYTGLLYTPLLPLLVAALDELGVWSGWPALVCVASTGVLAVMIGRLAVRGAGNRRPATLAGAAGMGGVAVWLTTSTTGLLYLGWSDELAWAFALGGLIAGARARSARAVAGAVILFTLAFWTKQTTIAAALAYGVWLALLTAWGRRSVRFTLSALGGLLAVNLVVLGLFALATGGWEFYFNFTLPTRQAQINGVHQFAHDLVDIVLAPAAWTLALTAAALGRRWRERARLDSTGGLLALFVVIGLPLAMYFRSKQGGETNQYFGIVWALGAIAALAWGTSRRRAAGARGPAHPADALVVLALLGAGLATVASNNRFDLRLLRLPYTHSIPADLRALGTRGGVFHPYYTDLTPHLVYPDVFNSADVLASGKQPMSVVRRLLRREFRYAVTYASVFGPGGMDFYNAYASAYGAYEANYFWKLDQVIQTGYRPAPGLPPGVLERRPGPNTAAALSACFGPFHWAGATWTIRRGGGFWCQKGPQSMVLDGAPATASELISAADWTALGALLITADPGAAILLTGGNGWAVAVWRERRGWKIEARARSGHPEIRTARGSMLRLGLGESAGVQVQADLAPSRISIEATPDRGVRLNSAGLRLAR